MHFAEVTVISVLPPPKIDISTPILARVDTAALPIAFLCLILYSAVRRVTLGMKQVTQPAILLRSPCKQPTNMEYKTCVSYACERRKLHHVMPQGNTCITQTKNCTVAPTETNNPC